MSVFDVDNNIESIDDNIRKYHEDKLKKTGYWYNACVQSYNDLHSLDNVYNGIENKVIHKDELVDFLKNNPDWKRGCLIKKNK